MTEGTYIFLFITAIALGWKSLTTNSPYFALLTGLVSALAYLTRPEGICLPVLATFWSGIHLLKSIPTLKRLQILRNVGYLWMVFFILAFPYLLFIRGETGKWSLSKKASVQGITKHIEQPVNGSSEESGSSNNLTEAKEGVDKIFGRYGKYLGAIIFILITLVRTYHPLLFILLIVGFVMMVRSRQSVSLTALFYILSYFLVYFPPLYLSLLINRTLSSRYLLPGVVLTLFWSGIGFVTVAEKLTKVTHPKEGHSWRVTLVSGLVLCLILLTPVLGKAQRYEQLGQKMAGQWIKTQGIKKPIIVSNKEKVAYYAEGMLVPMSWGAYTGVINFCRISHADFLVLSEVELRKRMPDFYQRFNKANLELVYRYPSSTKRDTPPVHTIIVFKLGK